jgi:phage head maturation protease
MTIHQTLLLREASLSLAHRKAAARPQSFDAEARTIEAIIATETPVRRRDVSGEFLEILSVEGADIEALRGASVLDSHQQHGLDNVLGTVDDVWREASQLVARIRFSEREEIADVVADVASGVLSHVSVGYEIGEVREGTDANGNRTVTATRWSPREISFVPVPADPLARTRTRARAGANPSTGRASINRSIRDLCHRANMPQETIDDLVDRGATIEEAREMVLTELMLRGSAPIRTSVHADQSLDNPAYRQRAMADALLTRVNPKFTPSPQARQFVGLSIPEIARECCRRAGIQLANTSGATVVTRALHSTSDFPALLADVVGRTLRESYTAAPSALRSLARERTAQDFRTMYRVQLDSLGLELLPVPETGEFKRGTMSDSKKTYKLATYGRVFGISRQALINDDLGGFTDLSARLGQAAASFEAKTLVDLLVSNSGHGPKLDDTKTLFHVDHGNTNDMGSAPSEAALSQARLAMRKQTSPTGGVIDITPVAVLAPSELETTLEKLLTQIQAVTTSDVNPFARLRLVIEPRLTDPLAWYVVATSVDGLEYAYLAGMPGPQVESRNGFDVDGLEIRVRLDFGAGFVDPRGWYKNFGAGVSGD